MYTENIAKKTLIERLIKEDKISLDEGLLLLEKEVEQVATPYVPYTPYPIYPDTTQPWFQHPVIVSSCADSTVADTTVRATFIIDSPNSSPYVSFTC